MHLWLYVKEVSNTSLTAAHSAQDQDYGAFHPSGGQTPQSQEDGGWGREVEERGGGGSETGGTVGHEKERGVG